MNRLQRYVRLFADVIILNAVVYLMAMIYRSILLWGCPEFNPAFWNEGARAIAATLLVISFCFFLLTPFGIIKQFDEGRA